MNIRVAKAWAPKDGANDEEYEDAYLASPGLIPGARHVRLAVADGATESAFARLWARQLVSAYGQGRLRTGALLPELRLLARAWLREAAAKPVPWYVEEKVAQGAHAAFAGIELSRSWRAPPRGPWPRSGTWRAIGLGDSCVFQIRGDRLLCQAPVASSADFGSRPLLVPTALHALARAAKQFWRRRGRWHRGDSFLLMTDAIACWFLRQAEAGNQPWRELEALLCHPVRQDEFKQWLQGVRGESEVRNDDVTVVWASLV